MTFPRKPRLREVVTLGLAIGAGFAADHGAAFGASPTVATVAAPAASFKPARPYWIELTLAQRQALTPLADDWERLDMQTKKKWIEIANRYPHMSPDEQGRSQQRMREWAMLTPDQRRVARDSFARVRAMNPEQRAEMLRKYEELPPEKKQALVTEGRSSRVIVVPKPVQTPIPRRMQIGEGAKVANPVVAAQKSVHPPAPPVRVAPPPPAPVAPPVPSDAATTAATPPAAPTTPNAVAPVAPPAASPAAARPAS